MNSVKILELTFQIPKSDNKVCKHVALSVYKLLNDIHVEWKMKSRSFQISTTKNVNANSWRQGHMSWDKLKISTFGGVPSNSLIIILLSILIFSNQLLFNVDEHSFPGASAGKLEVVTRMWVWVWVWGLGIELFYFYYVCWTFYI